MYDVFDLVSEYWSVFFDAISFQRLEFASREVCELLQWFLDREILTVYPRCIG